MAVKKVAKKKASKKKVTKKKATKKKVVAKEAKEYFVTIEEDLLFDQGVLKQKLVNAEIDNASKDFQLYVLECKKSQLEKLEKIEELKRTKLREVELNQQNLDRIRKRLGFEGPFAVNHDTLRVVFPNEE